jgi:arginase family enzyme
MVARLIHRHAIADRHYPGASAGQLRDLLPNDIALFGAEAESARAIRDAAHGVECASEGSARSVDLGNLMEPADQLPAVLKLIIGRGARPVMLGGDAGLASVFAQGLARAFASAARAIILLSPRLDVRLPQADGHPALAIGTTRLISKSSHDAWRKAGGDIIPAASFDIATLDAALRKLAESVSEASLLVDLGVIDTGYASGVTVRNVGGLTPNAAIEAAARVGAHFDLRGLAFLNLAPERDPRGHSERIAAVIGQRVLAQVKARQAA